MIVVIVSAMALHISTARDRVLPVRVVMIMCAMALHISTARDRELPVMFINIRVVMIVSAMALHISTARDRVLPVVIVVWSMAVVALRDVCLCALRFFKFEICACAVFCSWCFSLLRADGRPLL